ncbi:MAG: MFS transporter [Phycisphaerales bacterium]|nr:MFS transporter [Phycisphaerales bacterium]
MDTPSAPPPAQRSAFASLSMMMFLQYAVWGAWLPYLAKYLTGPVAEGGLGFTNGQMGWIIGMAASIGAASAPFLGGQIADRFMNAEKYLGILLILGGMVKLSTYYVKDYNTFLLLSILYSITYMPTLSLTNSIAFANLRSPEKQFPPVRTWGTIGWIVASTLFPLIWLQTNLQGTVLPPFVEGTPKPNATHLWGDCLRVSGAISILYGLWAMLFLPKTPPTHSAKSPFAVFEAFSLLKRRGFLVATIAALPISMIHQVYFMRTANFITYLGFADAHVGAIMSIGQYAEIIVLAVLGLFLSRIGFRWVLTLGALSFAARYAIFAMLTPETKHLMLAAMTLHGLCYGFFFAGAYVFVEKVAPKDIRHSAQTVFGIIILGLGPVLAGLYNQWLDSYAITSTTGVDGVTTVTNWPRLWFVQAALGLASALIVALFFGPSLRTEPSARAAA